jgi:hypothetical protein
MDQIIDEGQQKQTVEGPTLKHGYTSSNKPVTTKPSTVSPRCSNLTLGRNKTLLTIESAYILFIIRARIVGVIFEYVGRSCEKGTVGEHLE